MKRIITALITVTFLLAAQGAGFASTAISADDLPEVLKIELKRLEETWNILDHYSENVWTGWNNYKEVPFRFSFPNGLQMLVGHPSPPDGFQLLEGVEVQGKKVYLDRTKEIPLKLTPPLSGGGGPLTYGKDKRVETVCIMLSIPKEDKKKPSEETKNIPPQFKHASDKQIMIYIHELFHCFQRELYRYRYGNLRMNTDANYALYADIEGEALENAYLQKDDKKAAHWLKIFLTAREQKRKNMKSYQKFQESEEEFMEGTAVYSEYKSLLSMKKGYKPKISKKDDPHFQGFAPMLDYLLEDELDTMRKDRKRSMNARDKSYSYGCFQALLLDRFAPGWKKRLKEKAELLDRQLADTFKLTPAEKDSILKEIQTNPDFDKRKAFHAVTIKKRNDAYQMFQARKGRKYIINFKKTGEYINPVSKGETYNLGIIHLYPEGIEEFQVEDVIFTGKNSPILKEQLYYLKWIDTEAGPTEKSYQLTYAEKEGDDIYTDVVFKTAGFVLKAPKIHLKDRPSRVKVTILSKVKATPATSD